MAGKRKHLKERMMTRMSISMLKKWKLLEGLAINFQLNVLISSEKAM